MQTPATIKITWEHRDYVPHPNTRATMRLTVPKPKIKQVNDARDWLMLACAHDYKLTRDGTPKSDPQRPILTAPYADKKNKATVSADGFRLHLVKAIVKNLPKPVGEINDTKFPDYRQIFPPDNIEDVARGRVSTYHLIRALESAHTIAQYGMDLARVSINGSFVVSASDAEAGDMSCSLVNGDAWSEYHQTKKNLAVKSVPVVYEHAGANISTAFNCRLLIEALSGLGEVAEYRVEQGSGHNAKPLLLRGEVNGEVREALLMPMFRDDTRGEQADDTQIAELPPGVDSSDDAVRTYEAVTADIAGDIDTQPEAKLPTPVIIDTRRRVWTVWDDSDKVLFSGGKIKANKYYREHRGEGLHVGYAI